MDIIEQIEQKFTSGNSVEIDSIRLTHAEWEALKEAFAKEKINE